MLIQDTFTLANTLCEETETNQTLLNFFNNAIAYINSKIPANYPFIDISQIESEYLPISETFQRTIIVNYIAHEIKVKDSSRFEYTDFLEKVEKAFKSFTLLPTPETYKLNSDISMSIPPEFSNNYYRGGW